MDKPGMHVYVGMSGGVDSSVTAALLKEQGYRVTGVYMKNWTTDLPGFTCPWAEDLADAKRVAVQLDIPFKVFDFQKEYKQHVVDYMIREYQAGRTPNPDVMCNQEIKFDLFLRAALADGADMIATGHYARVAPVSVEPAPGSVLGGTQRGAPSFYPQGTLEDKNLGLLGDRTQDGLVRNQPSRASSSGPPLLLSSQEYLLRAKAGAAPPDATRHLSRGGSDRDGERHATLLTGLDQAKDQSYFLYRVTSEALSRTLLPIGELTKAQVREQARRLGLVTADKKDSQGICFVGKVGIKDFLSNYVDAQPGDIVDKKTGKVIGQHDGAIFYTIGQRQGLHVGGGLPYYVVGKDMKRNIVYVTTDLNDETLWKRELTLTSLHWINEAAVQGRSYEVRTRYRAPLVSCRIDHLEGDELRLTLDEPERALTPGQSAVLYQGDRVVGGGIVV